MRIRESGPVLGVALLLALCSGAPGAAQGTGALAFKSVHGKLETINPSVNGVAVISDEGQRMAWQFDARVIEKIKDFKKGDPVVVIYRQLGAEKAVTAIAFPGAVETPVYVNTTDQHPRRRPGRDGRRLLVLRPGGPDLHAREQDGAGPRLPDPLLRVTG